MSNTDNVIIYSFISNKCKIKKKKRENRQKIHIETKLNEQNEGEGYNSDYLRSLLLQMDTAGNSNVSWYSTLRSTFFGYERRCLSLPDVRYAKTDKNPRRIRSHITLICRNAHNKQ